MNDILAIAKQVSAASKLTFTKFITANDVGATGGHQAGFHIHKNAWSLFFDDQGKKGENKDIFINIKWQNDFITTSRFIYYGVGTRNEYRLTRFGKNFPFLSNENIGDLLIISKIEDKFYEAFVLSKDVEIEDYFIAFGISSTETNKFLPKNETLIGEKLLINLFEKFINELVVEFPSTLELANKAREIFIKSYYHNESSVFEDPDKELLNWITTEYNLFKSLENNRYNKLLAHPFPDIDTLIETANTILNRRKSRAGKSLEHHLSEVFNIWQLKYIAQPITENRNRPDFIFPDIESYRLEKKGSNKLIFLGAKTTCKDRWRQIVGEADKIPFKHLFTLQQGISANQLNEMKSAGVTLVVPKPYLSSFPREHREEIWTLDKFVKHVKYLQE